MKSSGAIITPKNYLQIFEYRSQLEKPAFHCPLALLPINLVSVFFFFFSFLFIVRVFDSKLTLGTLLRFRVKICGVCTIKRRKEKKGRKKEENKKIGCFYCVQCV